MLVEDVKKLPVFERTMQFIQEREAVRLKKAAGLPKPWTDDVRLLEAKFTCPRRMDDRVSVWLEETWYKPYHNHGEMLAACCLARMLNVPEALTHITGFLFRRTAPPFLPPSWAEIERQLRATWQERTIFNSAYIVPGKKGEDKLKTVLDRVRAVEKNSPGVVDPTSMERTHAAVMKFDGFGSFLAGQVVADLRWAVSGTWADKDTWAPPGPGSKRGIERLLSESYTLPVPKHDWQTEFQKYMAKARAFLPRTITSRMEAMDWQNTLCDCADKAERLLEGSGRTKCKYPGRPESTLF